MDRIRQVARTLCCLNADLHLAVTAAPAPGQDNSEHSLSSASMSSMTTASLAGRARRQQIVGNQDISASNAGTEEDVLAGGRRSPELALTSSGGDDALPAPTAQTDPSENMDPVEERSSNSAEGEVQSSPGTQMTEQGEAPARPDAFAYPLPLASTPDSHTARRPHASGYGSTPQSAMSADFAFSSANPNLAHGSNAPATPEVAASGIRPIVSLANQGHAATIPSLPLFPDLSSRDSPPRELSVQRTPRTLSEEDIRHLYTVSGELPFLLPVIRRAQSDPFPYSPASWASQTASVNSWTPMSQASVADDGTDAGSLPLVTLLPDSPDSTSTPSLTLQPRPEPYSPPQDSPGTIAAGYQTPPASSPRRHSAERSSSTGSRE